ncbi:MAG: patatin-like phospholipase family protein [Rhodospirillum sp.]|nr:patatin-like phospholipase family protein [Rhodospirillum sp.]
MAVKPKAKNPINALVLGGGAPNFTLMTGALLALEEKGFHFDVVTGAGGGGAVALSYLAPKGVSRIVALKSTMNLGVSDAIYKVLPVNYKVFQKGGKLSAAFRNFRSKMPGYSRIMNQTGMSNNQKFVSDLIQAWWALTTPTLSMMPWSKGLCANDSFVTEIVDFDKLKTIDEAVYLNTYSITNHKMVVISKDEINETTFGASGAFPFIYPPAEVLGNCYIEGATQEACNFAGLLRYMKDTGNKIDNLVILNAFGNEQYLQKPKSLWTAYGQSIIAPLIALDKANLTIFHDKLRFWNETQDENARMNVLCLDFPIPPDWAPTALDWSRSNLERLFYLGYEEAKTFLKKEQGTLGFEYSDDAEARMA